MIKKQRLKTQTNKPRNHIRRLDPSQMSQPALKASFIIFWLFPLVFTKHGEPFPEPFGHAQQRSAEALMSDKEFSLAIVGT